MVHNKHQESGPMRKVLGSRINEFGRIVELLECGHEHYVQRHEARVKGVQARHCGKCPRERKET